MERCGIAAAVIVGALSVLRAQSPAVMTFDVASVKVNRSGIPGGYVDTQPARILEINQTLQGIVLDAYAIQRFRVFGGPDWVTRDRFDVDGRAGRAASREELQAMLRALLADSFKLVVRRETRDFPAYALTLTDGSTGPRLRPASAAECIDRDGPPAAGQLLTCGSFRAGPGRISGRSVTVTQFIEFLSPRVDRVVFDRSGASGPFDLDLEWTPEAADRAAVAALAPGGASADADPNLPGIVTALREQLGLRLQPITAPVEVLVIVSAEHPAEN